jgi:hypothetical protein
MAKKDKPGIVEKKKLVIDDPLEALRIVENAISRKEVDPEMVVIALRQVLSEYEQQLRVFSIAAARAEIPRVVNLLKFVSELESRTFDPVRLETMTDKDLIRLYTLSQAALTTSLDNIKKVADMRLEMLQAGAKPESMLSTAAEELAPFALDAPKRERIRNIIAILAEEEDDD